MKFCANCGKELVEGGKCCANCGASVPIDEPVSEPVSRPIFEPAPEPVSRPVFEPVPDAPTTFCVNCGEKIAPGVRFCPACGMSTDEDAMPPAEKGSGAAQVTAAFAEFNDTADATAQIDDADIAQNKVMAVLAYFGLLVLIPIFAAKDSRYARFHANQGLVLFIASVAWWIISMILGTIISFIAWRLLFIMTILNTAVYVVLFVLMVLGIINAAKGRAKELPIIGGIHILK